MAPNGMILMIWGPVSIRRNDLHALSQSGVLAKWAAVMVPGTAAYYLYGDSIYPWRTHLRSRHGAPAGPLHREDKAMSSCRQLIENGFGLMDIFWLYLTNKQKLMAGFPVKEIFFCKALFTNIYLLFYEGQTSTRFSCLPGVGDSENWLAQYMA